LVPDCRGDRMVETGRIGIQVGLNRMPVPS
jgi:hypothetical protein